MNARAMAGRRCIVRTLLGVNPKVSSKKRASSSTSGDEPLASGVTSGIRLLPCWAAPSHRLERCAIETCVSHFRIFCWVTGVLGEEGAGRQSGGARRLLIVTLNLFQGPGPRQFGGQAAG